VIQAMNPTLERLRDELASSLSGLDARQTQLRPGGDAARWSTQQIAGHLRLTYAVTVIAMDARIEKASATKAKPSMLQYAAQFTLIQCGLFPRGRKAPERVTASPEDAPASGEDLTAQIDAALKNMDRRIDAAETIFGDSRRVISHMVLGPLSISQWRRFHLIHGRHHIKQIQAIRREYGL
jgi:hypothetical protein